MRMVLLALPLALAACADWPDLGAPPADAGPWPRLLPIGEVLGAVPPSDPDAAAAAERALLARAARLRARAAILRGRAESDADLERLRARLAG